MKNIFTILLAALALTYVSCSDDEGSSQFELAYDGPNDNAPSLFAGVHEAGVRFTPSQTAGIAGRQLEAVQFYLQEYPDRCEVLVYDEGSPSSPGALLYSADMTFETENFDWNTHVLTTPITITGDDVWIVIRVEHVEDYPSIGCDAGPANSNGDWMKSSNDDQWRTFRNRTGNSVSINWNIRGLVSN